MQHSPPIRQNTRWRLHDSARAVKYFAAIHTCGAAKKGPKDTVSPFSSGGVWNLEQNIMRYNVGRSDALRVDGDENQG